MEENKRIIEINGIKLEVDLSTAKVVNEYKVGDNIKVLIKGYSDWKSHIGTIIGFDNFETHPTIVIAYLDHGYSSADIKFVYFNSENKDLEIAPLNEWDIPMRKSDVIREFDRMEKQKEEELRELINKRKMFEKLFGKFFESITITS